MHQPAIIAARITRLLVAVRVPLVGLRTQQQGG